MKVSRSHLAEVIAQRTLRINSTKQLAKEIAAYLLIEARTADLESLLRDVLSYRAEKGLIEATSISAHQLSADVKKELLKELKSVYPHAKNIRLDEEIDENLIGGVKLEMPGQQLDLSVRAKLAKFRQLINSGGRV